jgi:hypothetical protein
MIFKVFLFIVLGYLKLNGDEVDDLLDQEITKLEHEGLGMVHPKIKNLVEAKQMQPKEKMEFMSKYFRNQKNIPPISNIRKVAIQVLGEDNRDVKRRSLIKFLSLMLMEKRISKIVEDDGYKFKIETTEDSLLFLTFLNNETGFRYGIFPDE